MNTSKRIFTKRGYVWPVETLNPEYLAPKQFSKMAEGSDDFLVLVFTSNFVFTWVIPITSIRAWEA